MGQPIIIDLNMDTSGLRQPLASASASITRFRNRVEGMTGSTTVFGEEAAKATRRLDTLTRGIRNIRSDHATKAARGVGSVDKQIEALATHSPVAARRVRSLVQQIERLGHVVPGFRGGAAGGTRTTAGRSSGGMVPYMGGADPGYTDAEYTEDATTVQARFRRTADPWDYYQAVNRKYKASRGRQFREERERARREAREFLQDDADAGDPAAVRRMSMLDAEDIKEGMSNSNLGSKFRTLVRSTRFNVGGGMIQPLLGRFYDVAEALFEINPAAGLAAAGLGSVATATMAAAGKLRSLATGRAIGGGSGSDAAAVDRVAQYFGMSGTDLARSLQSGFESGYGTSAASRYGINAIGGPYGDNNYNQKAIKFLRGLGNEKTFEDARRTAEMVGMPELADFQRLSKGTQSRLLESLTISDDQLRAASEFNAELSIMQGQWTKLAGAMSPLIRAGSAYVAFISDLTDRLSAPARMVTGVWDSVAKSAEDQIRKMQGGARADAIQANTRATEENTRQLKEMRQVMGGGQRASGAIPGSIKHSFQFNDQAVRQSLGSGVALS